jgi:hypothetical protein
MLVHLLLGTIRTNLNSYVPNITPAGCLALAATVARRSANPVRDFLHRYLGREHIFSATTVSSLPSIV